MASCVVIESDSDTNKDFRHQISKAEAKLEAMRNREREKKQQNSKAEQVPKVTKKKERQREFDKAVQEASREARREKQTAPQERLKRMVLILDSSLAENSEFMESLVGELGEAGVEYRVGQGGAPGGVRWRRKQPERIATENSQVSEVVSEKDENYLLVTLEAQGFAGLVQYSKMAEQAVPLPAGAKTLRRFYEEVKREQGDTTISLAVEGMDKYFRSNKTKANRQFRKQVLGAGSSVGASSSALPEVTWLDCQEAIASLQLATGTSVRLCTGPEQLAEHVLTLTKAICKKPFSKESHFSFHPEAAVGRRKRAESGDQVGATWRNQLMQFNNLSEPMASAIVAAYPSPACLLSAYSLLDNESAALLLQDITVRRGVGTVASTRRLGPVLSRRIHTLLTTTDPHLTIT